MKEIMELNRQRAACVDDDLDYLPCRGLSRFEFEYNEYDLEETEVPFFGLQISFVDPSYKAIQMVPEFDIQMFVHTVGGYFGLFLGVSLLSLWDGITSMFDKIKSIYKPTKENETKDKGHTSETKSNKSIDYPTPNSPPIARQVLFGIDDHFEIIEGQISSLERRLNVLDECRKKQKQRKEYCGGGIEEQITLV